MRRLRGRQSLREKLIENKRGLEHWAALHGAAVPERLQIKIPEQRTRARRVADPTRILEKHVLAAGLDALRHDPRVAFVDRRQSGLFQDGDRYIRVGTPGTLDISGMLIGGRYFELEAKRPGQRPDPRQAERIAAIRANGGISGYFTSAEECIALLP